MKDESQYGEGLHIANHFAGRVGRFLDIGSYNGVALSNTWILSQLGWSGVCVEPSPEPFANLMVNYAGNDRVTLVNAALTVESSKRLVPFFSTADALSSTELKHREKFAAYPFTKIFIPSGIGWKELLEVVDNDATGPFDFVNIDSEGTNAKLLAEMPIRPEMVCVEYDPDADGVNTVHKILDSWGYDWTQIGGNVLGVRP